MDDILNALTKEERTGTPQGFKHMSNTSPGDKNSSPALKLSDLTKTPADIEDDTEAQALKEELEASP